MFKQLGILSKFNEEAKEVDAATEKAQVEQKNENVEERVSLFQQKNKPENTRTASPVEDNPMLTEAVTNNNPRFFAFDLPSL